MGVASSAVIIHDTRVMGAERAGARQCCLDRQAPPQSVSPNKRQIGRPHSALSIIQRTRTVVGESIREK